MRCLLIVFIILSSGNLYASENVIERSDYMLCWQNANTVSANYNIDVYDEISKRGLDCKYILAQENKNINSSEDEFKYCTDSSNFLQKKVTCNGPGEYSVSKNQFCTTLPGAQNLESIFWYDDEIISECAPIMGLTNRDSKIAFCKKYATYDHTKKGCARLFGFSKAVIDDFNLIEYEKGNTNSYVASTASDAGIVYCQDGDGIVYKREYECDFGRGQWEISKKIYDDWIKRSASQTVTQTVQVPDTKVDKIAPVLDVEDRITVTERNYNISGTVLDESDVFVEADGISIPVKNNKFTINGSSSIGITKYKIVAFDKWGNETTKDIIVERVMQVVSTDNVLEPLKPENLRSKNNKNRIALIIGIEEYKNISNANYAKRDAQLFIDYVQSAFGVPQSNIKYFFNENAQEASKFEIKDWLKKTVREKTEVYVYFSGHGMALDNGQELYLLTNDTRTQYIKDTALNRNEIFNDIAQYNPKSVTAFLDTCYSGAGRADGEILLAMAKGLVVVDEQQQKLPDNFTLFTAASAQESAWSLPEAKHGTFSYFLMKGMEGNADLNGDKKLTNAELRDYLLDNVGRYAQQQQTPQMVGDPDQVLIKF